MNTFTAGGLGKPAEGTTLATPRYPAMPHLFSLSVLFSLVLAVAMPARIGAAAPQIRPGQPWLDTSGDVINAHGYSVLHHEGSYYWYGSWKIPGKTEAEKNEAGVSCYVSDDLVTWRNLGLVLSVTAAGMHPDIADAGILDRPKIIRVPSTGRFVMHFKLYPPRAREGTTGTDVAYTGVAVADRPEGPFVYHGKFLGADSPNGSGDFALFQDETGTAFHVTVRKPDKQLVFARLTSDGLGPAEPYRPMPGVERATEAPALFRHDGRVYLLASGSTGWKPNTARLYVADRIDGPYRALGNPCRGVNPVHGYDAALTFGGQSTYVLPMPGRSDAWIAMFDVWKPEDPVNAAYLWLPLVFEGNNAVIRWTDAWEPGLAPRAR